MSRRNLSAVIRYLQQLTCTASANGASDAELLERYVRRRDEAAFELLLWRHAALVFNVCRRILPREQDAEDAFQATFLAFVRKAGSIRRRGSVASWLYKVAYRVALEAKEQTRKAAALEKPGGDMLAVQPPSDLLESDVRPILDAELNRLPERLRRPIVLCYLEGKSNAEAARELGCRLGTIYSRLARGRELLRQRLQRRGVTLSITGLTAALIASAAEAAPSLSLIRFAVRAALAFADPAATAAVSPRVETLAEGVLRTMFVTKLKIVAVMLLVVGLAAGGVWTHAWTASPQTRSVSEGTPPKPVGDDKKEAEPIPVKVVKPKPGSVPLMRSLSATVIAAQQQQIVPLISGTVKEVLVDIGDRVKKGQTLMVLDAPLLVQEVEEAMASVELAQAQVEEAGAVYEAEERRKRQGVGGDPLKARASLHAARAKVKLAQAVLEKARIQSSYMQLKAAFDGVVTRRTIDPGNFVQPSDSRLLRPLLTVQSIDRVRIAARVRADQARSIKRGLPVELVIYGEGKISGQKVARFSPTIENEETMLVEIDFENTGKHRLLPGMSGQVTAQREALTIPSSCVVLADDQPFVFIVRDGKAHRAKVDAVLGEGEIDTDVIKGIQASDLVITNPKPLKDGTPVKIEKSP